MNTKKVIRKNSHGFWGCLEIYGNSNTLLGQLISKKPRSSEAAADIDAELLKGVIFMYMILKESPSPVVR